MKDRTAQAFVQMNKKRKNNADQNRPQGPQKETKELRKCKVFVVLIQNRQINSHHCSKHDHEESIGEEDGRGRETETHSEGMVRMKLKKEEVAHGQC